jgi:DNA-binding MarR family transcriptional regulator
MGIIKKTDRVSTLFYNINKNAMLCVHSIIITFVFVSAKKRTETIDSKLKTTWQVVSRMYNTEAALYNATIAMAHFLLNVDSKEGSFASDIAQQLGMEGTSLSRIIVSLEEKKFIVRSDTHTDKRKRKITLSDKGKEQKELAKNSVRNFNHFVEAKIGKQRLAEFFQTIDEISSLAEERSKLLKPGTTQPKEQQKSQSTSHK